MADVAHNTLAPLLTLNDHDGGAVARLRSREPGARPWRTTALGHDGVALERIGSGAGAEGPPV